MRKFLDEDFLLYNETGKYLYHKYAENMPIIDYHCHLDAKDIAEDKVFTNLTELWLSGDHYKWRLMRTDGADEKFVTGDGDEKEKLRLWAKVVEKSVGNPLYHWTHMELKKYFNYQEILKEETVDEVIKWCEPYFESGEISARKLIEKSSVTHICTTDDPISDLRYHKIIEEDESFKVKVYPSWRPDKIMGIEKDGFSEYIKELGKVSGVEITNLEQLKKAIDIRIEFFNISGCKVSDHGLDYCFYSSCDEKEADDILKKALSGEKTDTADALKFKSAILLYMAGIYKKFNWVMQLHYGCSRNVNSIYFENLGPDTGIDCINPNAPSAFLAVMLNAFKERGVLPKTIVYSLDPSENEAIDSIVGCFQGDGKGYVQHGAAWWFNDHKKGMTEHIESLASMGVLGNFIGMLTDSRSFVSYVRHDYFRRIFVNLLGEWVEKGEYPYDEKTLEKIIKGVCYNNAMEYFNF